MATGVPKTNWNGHHHDEPQSPNGGSDFQLVYEGKTSEKEILATSPSSPHVLWTPESTAPNALYFDDNLATLSYLLQTLRGKVSLVYIDPPFASRMVYHSRKAAPAYTDLLSGAQYLEFLRRRLVLLRELLADEGSIYVHLDDKMAPAIKLIMDEVFGLKNFRNWITRKKCNPKNYTRNAYGNVCDYILFYSKTDQYTWNRQYDAWTPARTKEYHYTEKPTGRRYMKVPVHAPGIRNGATGETWRGVLPPPGKHWQFPPDVLDAMDARGEIYWSPTGNPRRKVYLDESLGVPVQDLWLDHRDAHNQNIKITGYPTEKNAALIARIIEASSCKGDLVLDCFSGSGTTLNVASTLGRHWIGIDNSPHAIATTLNRFAKGTEPMGDFVSEKLSRGHDSTLLLFSTAPVTPTPRRTSPHRVVSDFALYSSTPSLPPELQLTVTEWSNNFPPTTERVTKKSRTRKRKTNAAAAVRRPVKVLQK